ncbi:hydrolase [Candidatus Woesearchaeota archaeon]|jgi:nicotinamidase-related amidase|nr:hydrolase [Candidatus Woesearchaeota archaeon]MBT5271712.1 hydrolase [Candidatus Woesearchaeota archaeon]MBT6041098.1 hydrolase [Candidatus Woesearchaeota archaeon]MBT6337423.1 hydrolase [Candidatus Woesearchaeota archaeon]MBT7926916.1 hydrolase [Candidatus Woesearchaeota archaeon]
MNLGKLNPKTTAFILIDLQEKFIPAMNKIEDVIQNANILIKASEILKIPLIVTEQYPKGLGNTINFLKIPEDTTKIEKIHFSCFGCKEFSTKLEELKKKGITSLVLFGVEAHVCVLKTALDAIEKEFEVHVVADAVTSRKKHDKRIANQRMMQSGVFFASTEIILFQLIDKAENDEFKAISELIK